MVFLKATICHCCMLQGAHLLQLLSFKIPHVVVESANAYKNTKFVIAFRFDKGGISKGQLLKVLFQSSCGKSNNTTTVVC